MKEIGDTIACNQGLKLGSCGPDVSLLGVLWGLMSLCSVSEIAESLDTQVLYEDKWPSVENPHTQGQEYCKPQHKDLEAPSPGASSF